MKNGIIDNDIIENGLNDKLYETTKHKPAACSNSQPKPTRIDGCICFNCSKYFFISN